MGVGYIYQGTRGRGGERLRLLKGGEKKKGGKKRAPCEQHGKDACLFFRGAKKLSRKEGKRRAKSSEVGERVVVGTRAKMAFVGSGEKKNGGRYSSVIPVWGKKEGRKKRNRGRGSRKKKKKEGREKREIKGKGHDRAQDAQGGERGNI